MNRLDLLSELQTLDLRLEENRRLQQQAESRLADDSALATARAEFEAARRQADGIRARLGSLELETGTIDDKIKNVDARLYGGKIGNPKELSGLEQDELMLKRRKSEVEDRMLEVMAELETAEVLVRAKRVALEKISAARATSNAQDQTKLAELKTAAEKLNTAREQLRAQIAPPDRQVYDDLLRTKKGRAIVHIKSNSCPMCGFGVPSGQASRIRLGELEFCTNCGRVLVQ